MPQPTCKPRRRLNVELLRVILTRIAGRQYAEPAIMPTGAHAGRPYIGRTRMSDGQFTEQNINLRAFPPAVAVAPPSAPPMPHTPDVPPAIDLAVSRRVTPTALPTGQPSLQQNLLNIAASLTSLLATKGVSPNDLAQKASVPVETIHSVMIGQSGDLTLNNLAALLGYLDATPIVIVRQQAVAGQGV